MTGGWAATNTLREAIHDRGMDAWEEERPVDPKHVAALALVEAALDAAERISGQHWVARGTLGVTVNARDYDRLAAALRAVREGK